MTLWMNSPVCSRRLEHGCHPHRLIETAENGPFLQPSCENGANR